MKNITKWARINGTYIALTDDNVMVGFIKDVKPVIRPPERVVDEFE